MKPTGLRKSGTGTLFSGARSYEVRRLLIKLRGLSRFVLLLAIAALAITAFAQTKPGDVANGKTLFMRNGCYQCHGTVGQGGSGGARLAQIKLNQQGFINFVRNPPSSNMPPYRAKLMSDQELADVYAFIKTFPEPKPVKDIPILNE